MGSYYSDQPDNQSLWGIGRFVSEGEQVRDTLGLDKENFYLFGQSWGGMLAIEYALKHQHKLKGLVMANTMPIRVSGQITMDSFVQNCIKSY